MHQGQVLALPSGTHEMVLWSPWIPKGGDRAVFTYELVATFGSVAAFEIEVWTKAREDRSTQGTRIAVSGDFSNVSGTLFYTAPGINGFDEIYRVRIRFEGDDSGGGIGAVVIYRFLEPTWFVLAGSQS